MLSKLVPSRNLSLSQSRNRSLSHWKLLNQGRTYFLRTTASKPDDGDDRMEKKSENVAHARDGIKLKNLKN
jgi:hypothetical protein